MSRDRLYDTEDDPAPIDRWIAATWCHLSPAPCRYVDGRWIRPDGTVHRRGDPQIWRELNKKELNRIEKYSTRRRKLGISV